MIKANHAQALVNRLLTRTLRTPGSAPPDQRHRRTGVPSSEPRIFARPCPNGLRTIC